MTSPARGGPDTAGMREALLPIASAAMRSTENTEWLMDRLLPVVQRLAVEKAAEALKEARQHACCDADEHRLRVRRERGLAAAAVPLAGQHTTDEREQGR